MSEQAITITLPLPDRALHAHNKGHWRGKRDAVKRARDAAWAEAHAACGGRPPRWDRATLNVRFYWPDRRRRDTLNAAHSLKPSIDGIVDAGIVADDSWEHLAVGTLDAEVDKENPRVEISIEGGQR